MTRSGNRRRWKLCLPAMAVAVLVNAGKGLPSPAMAAQPWPPAGSNSTADGRKVWIDNCLTCHGYGIAGAPIPTKEVHWRDRLSKDKAVLYQHAIEGFFGPEGTQMPPRGGNNDLTDAQVMSAVDYMLDVAIQHISSD